MRTALAMVVGMVLVAGCGPETPNNLDPSWPAAEQSFRIGAEGPECDDPESIEVSDEGDRIACSWSRVTVDGAPTCLAIVVFAREDADSPWADPIVFVSHATVCP